MILVIFFLLGLLLILGKDGCAKTLMGIFIFLMALGFVAYKEFQEVFDVILDFLSSL